MGHLRLGMTRTVRLAFDGTIRRIGLMPLSCPPLLRHAFRFYVSWTHSDGPSSPVLCSLPQDPLELPVDRLPEFGRVLLRSAGELDRRVRRGVLPDLVQAIDQQPDGLAVLAVVLQQGLPEPLVPRQSPTCAARPGFAVPTPAGRSTPPPGTGLAASAHSTGPGSRPCRTRTMPR